MTDILAWFTGLLAALGFGAAPVTPYSGYVEGDYVYVAPLSSGTIDRLPLASGDRIEAGALLFTLASPQQQAAVAAARANVAAAEAALDNLSTGSRDDEINVIKANLQKAEASLSLARDVAARSGMLFAEGLISQSKLDQDRSSLATAEASVKELQAQLKVAELPARSAQQVQAEAQVEAAKAELARAEADLADRQRLAPISGLVDQVFYQPGEMGVAGSPILSILPDGARKVIFYVPESERARFQAGSRVAVTCDGCAAGLVAIITRVASEAQYTPPIIYSREERQRLSYLVEAHLPSGSTLAPGQVVDVEAAK